MITERLSFFKKFIHHPGQVGSITPSSHYLASKMFRNFNWDSINTVVELGAGTGSFTSYIVDHKRRDCRFIVVEREPDMLNNLKNRFPHLIYGDKAEDLSMVLKQYDIESVDCIISGLPFALLEYHQRNEIVDNIRQCLNHEGIFIAFQYSLQMKKQFKSAFSSVHVGFELKNIPPAFIYYCKK